MYRHWKKQPVVPRALALPAFFVPLLGAWSNQTGLSEKDLLQEIVVKAILNHSTKEVTNWQEPKNSPKS